MRLLRGMLAVLALLGSSCVLSGPLHREDGRSPEALPPAEAGLFPAAVNGFFPEAVYIKTRTQTFNRYHYYLIHEGRIWYKGIGEQEPRNWTRFARTGLPRGSWGRRFKNTGAVTEISADADELVALSAEGSFYRYCFDQTIAHKSGVWLDKQGWPREEPLILDQRAAKNRAWALGKRNRHVLYYEDIFGNQHHNGTMEIATSYFLLEDGQEICYADTGLPSDFSRNFLGPRRGTFRAASLSASASTLFVINEGGEMYTRLVDFDTAGCDPMWFKYTYEPYRAGFPGTEYRSNLNEWGLPPEDWRPQPPIPLSGKAALTRHLTILQNGQGNGARELRVAGLDEKGRTGYWTKGIFEETWEFRAAPLFFGEGDFLKGPGDAFPGLSLDKDYQGRGWRNGEAEPGWEYGLRGFNILEGSCEFLLSRGGESCALTLHPVEFWTYLKRDYQPGRTGPPKLFWATLEISPGAFEGLSEAFVRELRERYAKQDRALFHYTLLASDRYVVIYDPADSGFTIFLTGGALPDRYPEFKKVWYDGITAQLEPLNGPGLTIEGKGPVSRGELQERIRCNRELREELARQIRDLKGEGRKAFEFKAGYLPLHYFAKITPFRFVDIPKIRTLIRFGNRIVLTNGAYVGALSRSRIWVNQRALSLLDVRLRCYEDLWRDWSSGEGRLPPWYSETVAAYWDLAGLPRTIAGSFYRRGGSPVPGTLSLVPSPEGTDLFGWQFAISPSAGPPLTGEGASLLIDPRQSALTIYARRGKKAAEKPLRLEGTLYIAEPGSTPLEREVLETVLKPRLTAPDQGLDMSIYFDGKTFDLREASPGPGDALIFRAVLTE